MTTTQPPSLGRIVHYVLANGQHRAAEIVNVLPDTADGQCNLRVLLDVHYDLVLPNRASGWTGPAIRPEVRVSGQGMYLGGDTLHVPNVEQDEGQAIGSWHWPERI